MMEAPERDAAHQAEASEADAEAPPTRRPVHRFLRTLGMICLFVVAIAGVELAAGGATAVAHEFGYTGNVAQMARLMSFGLYAVIIFAFAKRR